MFQMNQNTCSAQKYAALTFLSVFNHKKMKCLFSFFRLTSRASSDNISYRSCFDTTFIWPLLFKSELGRACLSSYIFQYKDLIGLYYMCCNYLSTWFSLSQIDILFFEGRDYIFISLPEGLGQWLLCRRYPIILNKQTGNHYIKPTMLVLGTVALSGVLNFSKQCDFMNCSEKDKEIGSHPDVVH